MSMGEDKYMVRKSKISPAQGGQDKPRIAKGGFNTNQKPAQCSIREALTHTHQLSPSSLREGCRLAHPGVIPKEEEEVVMLGEHRRRAEGHELQDLLRTLGGFGLQADCRIRRREGSPARREPKGAQMDSNQYPSEHLTPTQLC